MADQDKLIADERELTALIIRHARGTDRCDEALLRSCYHPDAYDDHGNFKGSGYDFAAFVVTVHRDKGVSQHSISNITLDIQGDVAFGETYVMLRKVPPGGEPLFGWGRYIDRFERRDCDWKIAYRRTTLEGMTAGGGYDASLFLPAKQDRTDLSYER